MLQPTDDPYHQDIYRVYIYYELLISSIHNTTPFFMLRCELYMSTCTIIIIIINLPKRKAYTKGKACTRCPPTKNKHTYTYNTLQTKQYTTKHKTVIKKLLDT